MTLVFSQLAGVLIRLHAGSASFTSLTENLARIIVVLLGAMVVLNTLGISVCPSLPLWGLAVLPLLWRSKTRCRTYSAVSMYRSPGKSASEITSNWIPARKDSLSMSVGAHFRALPAKQRDHHSEREIGESHSDKL